MVGAVGTWGVWAVLTAVGTVGAVVVAVGLQAWLAWRERRSRPELSLAFDPHYVATETNPKGEPIDYLRLAVSNAEGKRSAEDVQLLILEIQEVSAGPGGGGQRIWLANPALAWANSVDPLPRMTIPPGATRYADVGCWLQAFGVAQLDLHLKVVPVPGSQRHVVPPGRWRIRLAVTLSNADATFWDAEIHYDQTVSQGLAQRLGAEATITRVPAASA